MRQVLHLLFVGRRTGEFFAERHQFGQGVSVHDMLIRIVEQNILRTRHSFGEFVVRNGGRLFKFTAGVAERRKRLFRIQHGKIRRADRVVHGGQSRRTPYVHAGKAHAEIGEHRLAAERVAAENVAVRYIFDGVRRYQNVGYMVVRKGA